MRTFRLCALIVMLGALTLGQIPAPPVATGTGTEVDPFLIYNSDTVRMVFDDTYTADGLTLVRIEVELRDQAGTVVVHEALDSAVGLTPTDGKFSIPLRAYVEPLDNGLYTMRARVVDRVGNTSEWTQAYYALKAWTDIAAPGGCEIAP